MHTSTTLPFAHYGHQVGGTFNSIVTYASWAVTAACAAEVFYVFQHGKDLLAGFGLVHSQHDAISLLKFYGITGAVAFSLATHKYLKFTAAGLAVVTLAGMYGTQFHLKAERTFDTASLPSVTSPKLGTGNASSRDVPANPTSTNTAPANGNLSKLYANAKAAGYSVDRPLNAAEKTWCGEGDNAILNLSARFNCGTGYRWNPPTKAATPVNTASTASTASTTTPTTVATK